MNHIAELKLHQYMTDAVNGKSTMSDEIIHQVADDIKDALQRQFGGKVKRKDFTLRMSMLADPLVNFGTRRINLKLLYLNQITL